MKKLTILAMLLCSCGSYQYVNDTMLITEATDVSIFSNYDANIIRFVIKPRKPSFYFTNNYGYWGMRPLWMDFNFYQGNFYSYYSSFYRPWNYWDYYMRPWMSGHNWTQGPFNDQGYNVVSNSSRRTMKVEDKIALGKLGRSRLVLNKKPVVKHKPIISRKPIVNYNKPKPIQNSRPTFNSKPSYNSRPSYNSKPSNSSSHSLVVRRIKKDN